jgi:hypothetical protein
VYLKPYPTGWTANAGTGGYRISQFLSGRYLSQPLVTGNPFSSFCNLTSGVATDVEQSTAVKGQLSTVNGTRVLELDSPDGFREYVTDTNDPEVAEVFEPKEGVDGAAAAFTVSVGSPVKVTVPSASQSVAAADFGFTDGLAGQSSLNDVSATMISSAIANLHAAKSLTMTASGVASKQSYSTAMGFKAKQGCMGTVSLKGQGGYKFTVIGSTVYWDPDDQLWASGGSGSSAVISLVHGRYVEAPASDTQLSFLATLCNTPDQIGADSSVPSGVVTTAKLTPPAKALVPDPEQIGKLTTLNGVKVLPITDKSGNSVGVSDTGKLQLVTLKASDSGDSAAYTFKVGAPVTLTAPPASDVLPASELGI